MWTSATSWLSTPMTPSFLNHFFLAIADALFILPSTEDLDGTLVTLPPSLTKLLREKHSSNIC
ncbi:hypothetical protein GLYMA_02G155902v4 [Glycine max]|nr:hypothetical protein GLYMA_02G155902v4 [Glycine max]KAH1060524.1 hypothetical protein GYH30_004135 [Glycine max]